MSYVSYTPSWGGASAPPAASFDRSPCAACQALGHTRPMCPNDHLNTQRGLPSHRSNRNTGPCPCRDLPPPTPGTVLPGQSASQVGTPGGQSILQQLLSERHPALTARDQLIAELRQNHPFADDATLAARADVLLASRRDRDNQALIAATGGVASAPPPAAGATSGVTPTGGPPPGPPAAPAPAPNRPLENRTIITVTGAGRTGMHSLGHWQATLAAVNTLAPGLATTAARLRRVSFHYSSSTVTGVNYQAILGIYRSATQPSPADITAASNTALAVSRPFTAGSSGTIDVDAPAGLDITSTTNDLWVFIWYAGAGTASTASALMGTATVGVDIL